MARGRPANIYFIEQVREKAAEGKDCSTIAKELGASCSSVNYYVHRYGIEIKKGKGKIEILIEGLQDERLSLEEVLEEVGMKKSSLYRHFARSDMAFKPYKQKKEEERNKRYIEKYTGREGQIKRIINEEENPTLQRIGKLLGVTRERVRQIMVEIKNLYEQGLYGENLDEQRLERCKKGREKRKQERRQEKIEAAIKLLKQGLSPNKAAEKLGVKRQRLYEYSNYSEELKSLYIQGIKEVMFGKIKIQEKIRERREAVKEDLEQGLSPGEVAEKEGVSSPTIYVDIRSSPEIRKIYRQKREKAVKLFIGYLRQGLNTEKAAEKVGILKRTIYSQMTTLPELRKEYRQTMKKRIEGIIESIEILRQKEIAEKLSIHPTRVRAYMTDFPDLETFYEEEKAKRKREKN